MNSVASLFRLLSAVAALWALPFRASAAVGAEGTAPPAPWWSAGVERALREAGTNRVELLKALREAPVAQREGLGFLVAEMPARDAATLPASYLLENLSQAYEALEAAPWRERIPKEVFLNDVLPYASLSESRDPWRRKLRALAAPLIAGCTTPGEAAQRINERLFPLVKVKYSTQRHRADQGPFETLETGMASCTGLSILLVDACRAAGIPARVVATPLWINLRGNHTWVEIWDGGWHFTGAAEPDPKGLDRGWFTHDASQALKEMPQHAIYASTWRRTGIGFPMVWAKGDESVPALNVTERYTPSAPAADPGRVRLLVKVLDRPAGQRVPARVTVSEAGGDAQSPTVEGTSRGETADLNDILPFTLSRSHAYVVAVERDGVVRRQEFHPGTNAQEVVVVALKEEASLGLRSRACYAPRGAVSPLPPGEESRLAAAMTSFFVAPASRQATWRFPRSLDRLLQTHEPAVRRAAWEAYRSAPIHEPARKDFVEHQVRFDKHVSPYTVKSVGTRPAGGWALFIAMHGGGGVAKEFNDSQWRHMQIYYRDHPEAGGYLYVALRAPNDTWNGFYDDYVYPLVANLVQGFLLFGDVDPDKVFIMGYSHGGYGAFAIGPKMPDRFAAIHASAAAPTDGETTPRTLRNTVFSVMVGEKDTEFGRVDRDRRFKESVEALRAGRTDVYPVTVQVVAGNGHTGLPDRDKIADLYPSTREPAPQELTWAMTDGVIRDFYWLRCEAPAKRQEIAARCDGNRVVVTFSPGVRSASLLLDGRLVDLDQPVVVEVNGKASRPATVRPSLRVLCQTLARRGDPALAFTAQIPITPAGVR